MKQNRKNWWPERKPTYLEARTPTNVLNYPEKRVKKSREKTR